MGGGKVAQRAQRDTEHRSRESERGREEGAEGGGGGGGDRTRKRYTQG